MLNIKLRNGFFFAVNYIIERKELIIKRLLLPLFFIEKLFFFFFIFVKFLLLLLFSFFESFFLFRYIRLKIKKVKSLKVKFIFNYKFLNLK